VPGEAGEENRVNGLNYRQEIIFSLGVTHAAAITVDGKVTCWGEHLLQCEVPADLENVVAVSCGYYFTGAITRPRTC
jgi:hypothetical protein